MIRLVGGEVGSPLECTMNVIATFQSAVSVGDLVVVSTSNNWAINSAAAANADVKTVGIVSAVAEDNKAATVKWFGYKAAFEATYSGTPTLGQTVLTTAVAGQVAGSTHAANTDTIIVAKDSPTSGKICWLSV